MSENNKNIRVWYGVEQYDIVKKEKKIIKRFSDRRNAVEMVEFLVFEYLQKQNGVNTIPDIKSFSKFLYEESDKDLSNIPLGHYVVRDTSKDLDKLTVCKKYVKKSSTPGALYGKWKSSETIYESLFSVTVAISPRNPPREKIVKIELCDLYANPFTADFKVSELSTKLRGISLNKKELQVTKLRGDLPKLFEKCPSAAAPILPKGSKRDRFLLEIKEAQKNMDKKID